MRAFNILNQSIKFSIFIFILVEQIQRDYNVLYEQYCKNKTEVNTLKEKNKSLADTYEDIKNERQQYIPISVHNSSVNECKK